MLFTEPVVFFFSLWVSFSWAVLYLQFGSVPLIFRTNHNFTTEQTGAVFTSMCVGVILISVISIYQDRVAARFGFKSAAAEGRLYFVCVESVLLPIGMFWFGWTSFPSVPWIVPAMAVGCSTMGIFSIYLATFNYLADTYHRYASSAIAAQSCCKFPELLYLPVASADVLERPKSVGWSFSPRDERHVQQSRFPCSVKSAWRHCKFSLFTIGIEHGLTHYHRALL